VEVGEGATVQPRCLRGRSRKHLATSMNLHLLERITIEPAKRGGRACIRETRMRVCDTLEILATGASVEELLADHPSLEREDVLASLMYAATQLSHGAVLRS
jgi:uncharacterized protein (DUF433 family)